jgi:hypothetical protein
VHRRGEVAFDGVHRSVVPVVKRFRIAERHRHVAEEIGKSTNEVTHSRPYQRQHARAPDERIGNFVRQLLIDGNSHHQRSGSFEDQD